MSNRTWWGAILIIFGILFLLDGMDVIDFGGALRTFWPVLFILWGLKILFRRRTRGKKDDEESPLPGVGDIEEASQADIIDFSNVFGDVNVRVGSQMFKGGNVSTVFGDAFVDLMDARLADGEHEFRVHGVFGDLTILLPKDISFAFSGNSVFGDLRCRDQVQKGFSPNLQYQSPDFSTSTKKLRMYASQVFGDVAVRQG